MQKFSLHSLAMVMVCLVFVSCGRGKPQVVTGIQVQSNVVNQDLLLSLKAELNLGNMSFPSVTLPILHPRGQTPIGSVDLMPILGGKNQIKVNVNVSAISDLQASQASLPNGNLVPIIATNPTISIPLGAGAKLYLTLASNAVALGVAVPIKQFDGIGSQVGAINFFPVFAIDRALGAAGIFTGAQSGQNGFALVVDVTQYVNLQDIFVPQMMETNRMALVEDGKPVAKLNFNSQEPSQPKQDRINAMIFDLHQKRTKLRLR